jgi:hypothetical protein
MLDQLSLQSPRPGHERFEELPDSRPRPFVREVTLRVEALGRVRDHDLGSVHRVHVQEHKRLNRPRPRRCSGGDCGAVPSVEHGPEGRLISKGTRAGPPLTWLAPRRALDGTCTSRPLRAIVVVAAMPEQTRGLEYMASSSADDVSLHRSPKNPLISLRVGQ